jgi:hypothetical protein
VLLRQREDDRGDLEQSVLRNVRELVLPYVEKLKTAGLRPKEKNLLEVIRKNLRKKLGIGKSPVNLRTCFFLD